MLHASCLCGEVRLRARIRPGSISHCHCSMCRKQHGAAFATYGSVARDDLIIDRGADRLVTYDSSAEASRVFCGRCGSSLFFQARATPEVVELALGALDDEPDSLPVEHIFHADRPVWSGPYDDGLPRHDGDHDL